MHSFAAEGSLNRQLRSIVALLPLTGARVSELLQAKWRHVDLARRAWLIPVSKTGKSRYVPLSKAAIDIIDELPRFEGCPWLIPNPETRAPFVTIKHSWQTARKAARLNDLRIHDLRHSAASFMINSGVDLFAVGKVLGHADYKSTMRYSWRFVATPLVKCGSRERREICTLDCTVAPQGILSKSFRTPLQH